MIGFLIIVCSFVLLYLIYINSNFTLSPVTHNRQQNQIYVYRFNKYMHNNNSNALLQVFQEIFNSHNVNLSPNVDNTHILFFNTLNQIKDITFNMKYKNVQWCYSLRSLDHYCCKAGIYKIMRRRVSKQTLDKIFPISYIVNNPNDMMSLLKNFKSLRKNNTIFILKKNVQRQKGCTITVDETYIRNALKNKYTIVQHLLQNPYQINKRKINIRVYLLIHVCFDDVSMYIYKDGFIYYTAKPFVKDSINHEVNITTGYIDRQIYVDNPLTIQNLQSQLSHEHNALFETNMIHLFTTICQAIKPIIYQYDVVEEPIFKNKFNILGCDLAVDHDLNLKLMEINKGPDLDYKDSRDKHVKYNMVQESLKIVGIINDDSIPSNFIKIL